MKKLLFACAIITSFILASCQDEVVDELEVSSPSLSTDPDDEEPTPL